MKQTLFLLCLLFAIDGTTKGQNNIKYIAHKDSLRAEAYWDSAMHCRRGSQKRQHYLDSALVIQPHNAYFWQQKAMPLFKDKKYEAGMVFLDSAVKYDRREWIEYRAFIKCIFQKSYRESINDFNAARQMDGNSGIMDHSYDFYTGLCYLQLNKLDSAEYFMSKSIDNVKKKLGDNWIHPLDMFYMGIIQYEKEDYKKAIECFDKSLVRYKNFSDAKYYKVLCFTRLKKNDEALVLLKEANADLKEGSTINEDNSFYEDYPYQVKKYYIDDAMEWVGKLAKHG